MGELFFFFPLGPMTIAMYQEFLLNYKCVAFMTSWKAENFEEMVKRYLYFTGFFCFPPAT